MPFEEFHSETYKFLDFTQVDTGVRFTVARIDGNDVSGDDERAIGSFLGDVGKWETVVKAGLYLLSQFKEIDASTLQHYEGDFDSQKYTHRITADRLNLLLHVFVHLSSQERRRRTDAVLPIGEIYDQLKNVPRWRDFKRAANLIKGTLM